MDDLVGRLLYVLAEALDEGQPGALPQPARSQQVSGEVAEADDHLSQRVAEGSILATHASNGRLWAVVFG